MATIVSKFMGVLPIPLFKTPYTVNVPGYFTLGTNAYALINPFGDTPLIGEIYNHQQLAEPFTWFNVTGGEFLALRYAGTNRFTINGGWNSGGDTYRSLLMSQYAGSATYGFAWASQDPATSKYTSYAAIQRNGFFVNTNVRTLQPPPYQVGNTTAAVIENAAPFLPSYGGTFSNLPCCFGNFINAFAGSCFLLGNTAPPYLTVIIPGLNYLSLFEGLPYTVQLTNHASIADFETACNIPVNQALLNFLWGFQSTGAKVSRVIWSMPNFVVGALPAVLSDDTITFDANSNLNTQLTKYTASVVMAPIGVRGVLATDLDAQIDYFVSPDGSKYWRLQYIPQGSAIAPSAPSSAEAGRKFVDSSGIFWYTGASAQSGSVIQPLYSLGANIPYGVFSLNYPPYGLPCYEDDCGKSLGIDWPGTNIFSS